MKRRGMLLLAGMLMIFNTCVYQYFNHALKDDMSIYVVQIGRYKEKENVNATIKQLEDNQYKGYVYKDKNYVVITKILLDQYSANKIAKDLSNKGMSCVVKEYLVDSCYRDDIKNEKYKSIYKELKI